jgi:hypothetical protein
LLHLLTILLLFLSSCSLCSISFTFSMRQHCGSERNQSLSRYFDEFTFLVPLNTKKCLFV